jgi:hypothetical protein
MKSMLLAVCLFCFSVGAVAAAEVPTKDDAKALVKEAVAYLITRCLLSQ